MNEREYLIRYLLDEEKEYEGITIPRDEKEQRNLLRALMNVRQPKEISAEFLRVQDDYLKKVNAEKGYLTIKDAKKYDHDLYLLKGDITRLRVDAIVNAANSQMLGCFQPLHSCIDNQIHTYAGVQLRRECYQLMVKQAHEEQTGHAKITKGYNLPCSYVIHTVGPIVYNKVTETQRKQLASCYLSCMKCADENHLESIAFCCISTGVFHFPNEEACRIALETVKGYKQETNSPIKVIFNVFQDEDERLYERNLGSYRLLKSAYLSER